MDVLAKISFALNRRDEEPNQALAKEIAEKGDVKAVKDLVESLKHKNKNIANDCIKVLYEVGVRKPNIIAPYADTFLQLLNNKNNRLQWGGMAALNAITTEVPESIYSNLPTIIDAAEKGTAITRDGAVAILNKLYANTKLSSDAFNLLNDQLKHCPVNQLPMYAENAAPALKENDKSAFIKTLQSRLDEMEKESKRKRIEKVIKKLTAK